MSYFETCPKCQSDDVSGNKKRGEARCNECGYSTSPDEIALGPQVDAGPARCRALADSPLWREDVIACWPGPIAHEYGRLRELLAEGSILGAIWQLKDVAEITARFPACVMYMDVLTNSGNVGYVRELRNKMLGPAMSMGSWVTFADDLATHQLANPSGKYRFPQVAGMFRKTNGEQTKLQKLNSELVAWRNKNIGHGAFRLDTSEFLKDMAEYLAKLHDALREVADVWVDLELRTADGTVFIGASSIRNHHGGSIKEAHVLSRLPLFLAQHGSDNMLPLFPIIQLRRCSVCRAQDIFLFDARRFGKVKGQDRYSFIDYLAGHGQESLWYTEPELHSSIRLLDDPGAEAINDESSIDGDTLDGEIADLLDERAMAAQYLSPSYLRSALSDFLVQCQARKKGGVWWLQAPGHVGKSTFVTGLDPRHLDELKEKELIADLRVVTFYIRREYQIWPAQFVEQLGEQLKDALNLRAQRSELPRLRLDASQPAVALVEWLAAMRAAAGNRHRLLICIDGLDELAVEATEGGRSIIDFLPSPNAIPAGIYFVLTSRQPGEIPAGVIARMGERLAEAQICEVTTAFPAYRQLMFSYFKQRLTNRCKAWKASQGKNVSLDVLFDKVVEQSDGRFLYVSYVTDLLADETLLMEDVDRLPPSDRLFEHFLNELDRAHLDSAIGELFQLILVHLAAAEEAFEEDNQHLPAVAREIWQGLPLEILIKRVLGRGNGELTVKLAYALYTLKPIIGSWKGGNERHARYRLGLKGLVQIVRGRWPEKLTAVHEQLVSELLDRAEGAGDSEGANDIAELNNDELWRVRYCGAHVYLCSLKFQGAVFDLKAAVNRILIWTNHHSVDLRESSELGKAICFCQTWILLGELGKKMLGTNWSPEWCYALSGTYVNRGAALSLSCDLIAAQTDYGQAITLLEALLARFGKKFPPVWGHSLATAYMNRGVSLAENCEPDSAVADYGQAIALFKALCYQPSAQRPTNSAVNLASTYINRGNIWSTLGDQSAALADYGQAIVLMEALREELGGQFLPDMAYTLANAYQNRGSSLGERGAWDAGLADYEQAIALLEVLHGNLGEQMLPVWDNNLASAYISRGLALGNRGDLKAALADFNRAVELREALSAKLGGQLPPPLRNDLASAYIDRGGVFSAYDDLNAALADYRRAITLKEGLRESLGAQWPPAWNHELACAYGARGAALAKSSDLIAALEDYGQAIALLEELRAQFGGVCPPSWVNYLATAYTRSGSVLIESRDPMAALANYDQAIVLMEALREQLGEQWPPAWGNTLACTYYCSGFALIKKGEPAAGLSRIWRAIGIWELLREQMGDQWPEPWDDLLQTVYRLRGELIEGDK